MDNKKRPFQRHFPYSYPTFGTKHRPKPESAWKKSVYYWWWVYLKRNSDYIACCEAGGIGAMGDIYADFGDVRGDDFKLWWTVDSRGVNLFAEPRAEDSIRSLQTGEVFVGGSEMMAVSFPINLPKTFILKQFKKLLSAEHKGERGYQYAKKSKAKYKINGQPNLQAIELGLKIYDFKLEHPEMTLWEIGNTFPKFMMSQKFSKADAENATDNKNALAASVSRYLRKTKNHIEATGRGEFI